MNQKNVSLDQTPTSLTVTVSGSWNISETNPPEVRGAFDALSLPGIQSVSLRAGTIHAWDSSLLVFLVEIVRRARLSKIPVHIELPDSLERLIKLSFEVKEQKGSQREKNDPNFFEKLGDSVLRLRPALFDFLIFLKDIFLALWRFFIGRATMRRQDFVAAMYECSIQALPIVSITTLLFGLILAFVGAVQLTQFGVQIYVAGLVGIGMLRVMGAIMVGIVMAGRVGASYAALIGTMQVNEEVDALVTFGFSPIEFLVLPRMLALTIMVPILTLYADLMGIIGGYLVGTLMLDLNPLAYINATCTMVSFKQVLIGLVYATTFGIVIAIAGCYQGIRCGRSAQDVGLATTTAVVHSIVGIIVMTACITIICNFLGI